MAALSADKPRIYATSCMGPVAEYTTTEAVYEGSAVGENSSLGTVRNLNDGDAFLGFALRAAASAAQVTVVTRGLIRLTVTGGATATLGAAVYATTSDTFSTTDSGSDTQIGKIFQSIDTSTDCWVYFEGYQIRSV